MTINDIQTRQIVPSSGVSIGGAPVSYAAILAALVAVMAFIPASVVVGGMGGGWPLHDVIHPVVGLLLGPIAGPVASVIGMVVGMFIAPYTSLGPWGPVIGAMSAFTVGMVLYPSRSLWYIPWLITLVFNVAYGVLAIRFGVSLPLWISNVIAVQLALVLIAIPQVRNWTISTIRAGVLGWQLYVALLIVFFFASTAGIQANWLPAFATNPWPAEIWPGLALIIAVERAAFSAVGALVAFGLIGPLRRSSLRKASLAGY